MKWLACYSRFVCYMYFDIVLTSPRWMLLYMVDKCRTRR